jgi:hypothetical protein
MNATAQEKANFIAWLRARAIPYTRIDTGSTTAIKFLSRRVHFADGQRFRGTEFQLLKRLRARVREAHAAGLANFPRRCQFYKIKQTAFESPQGVRECCEVDLSQAYLTAAAKLDIVSLELYQQIKALKKPLRLRLLGAMATRKRFRVYDSTGTKVQEWIECDPAGKSAWAAICGKVGDDLANVAKLDKSFLAFWVDNYWTQDPATICRELDGEYQFTQKPDALHYERHRELYVDARNSRGAVFRFPLQDALPLREAVKNRLDLQDAFPILTGADGGDATEPQ